MPPKTILVVDDRINTLKVMMELLADEGYRVLQAGGGGEALEVCRREPGLDAILADLRMPDMSGLELYLELRKEGVPPPFIIMTAFGTVKNAVMALKQGVTDYLIKPVDFQEMALVLAKAIRERAMTTELEDLRRRVNKGEGFHGLISASPAMEELFQMVRTVGPTDASVLILGETGVGKELVARALHAESVRSKGPLVAINCAALTESLLEAELFGYAKGAFTGAAADRPGKLEAAHRGTLFLDEIGHMSLALQSKLLRFLEDRTFEAVGGRTSRLVDVRFIAATNADLWEMIGQGRFLSDLLYRIEVISLRIPPLRERPEDIPPLAAHFICRLAGEYGREVLGATPEAMEALMAHPWPGNVREMENALARAIIMSRGERITLDNLPLVLRDGLNRRPAPAAPSLPEPPEAGDGPPGPTLKEMEEDLIRRTLRACGGNKTRAAKSLGISRKAIYEKMDRLGIGEDEE